jgi:hypothetical protein
MAPNAGVDKLKAKHKKALTDYTKDIQARFKTKSKRCLAYQKDHCILEFMPSESHIELWPNVSKCVFISVNLDNELSPNNSTIESKNEDASVSDSLPDVYSVACFKDRVLEHDEDTTPLVNDVTSSTFMCSTTDDDSLGNDSFATLEVYKVNTGESSFASMYPRSFQK